MNALARVNREPWSIFDELLSLQDEFSRVFDGSDHVVTPGRGPAMNMWETDEGVVVEAELPGVDPKSVEVSVEGRELTLTAQVPEADDDGRYLVRELTGGGLERRVRLPYRVNNRAVKAACSNGLLQVKLPKADEDKPCKIQVKAA